VPLSEKGIQEAIQAGHRLRQIPLDLVYSSMLIRAQMTALIALAGHDSQMAPLIVKDTDASLPDQRGIRAHMRKMHEGAHSEVIPVYSSYQLDERDFGEMQGMHQNEQKKKYKPAELQKARYDFHTKFPGGESSAEVYKRVMGFFEKHIQGQLDQDKNCMICCHGFVIRVLIKYLTQMSDEDWYRHMALEASKDPKEYKRSLLRTENATPVIFSYDIKSKTFIRLDLLANDLVSML
jgi:2,3-bisphosphoglycerate-dependent phosphoglycerate mutase